MALTEAVKAVIFYSYFYEHLPPEKNTLLLSGHFALKSSLEVDLCFGLKVYLVPALVYRHDSWHSQQESLRHGCCDDDEL